MSQAGGPPFSTSVKPYFIECYRDCMISALDLWDPAVVAKDYDRIRGAIEKGVMPPPNDPHCPGWDAATKDKFLADFDAWKAGGFNPA